MTKYTVEIRERDGQAGEDQSTEDVDEALDWFTNAATEVIEDDGGLELATLKVGDFVWGVIERGGIMPPDGGEVVSLRKVA